MATFKKWIVPGGMFVVLALVLTAWQPAPLINGIAVSKFAHEASQKCGHDQACIEQLGKRFGATPSNTAR